MLTDLARAFMADSNSNSKTFMMLLRRILLLSLACSLLAVVCVVAAAAPAPADHDPSISSNGTSTTTSSVLPLRRAGAGAVAPSIGSTLHDLDTDAGGGRSASGTLCLHRASTEAYDGVVALKDGSCRLLFWKRDGQVWLSAGTTTGSGYVLQVGGKALIDLRTRVSKDSARGRGLAGVAVDSSSRLFVSYYTTTGGGGGAFLVVDQVSAPLSEHEPTTRSTRRVLSMALSDESQSEPRPSSWDFPLDYYGGQIMFRPTTTDPNLYLVTGPAQTDGQLRAKILRFPVGQGNGTVTAMEYASISGVPRGCSFDADRPHDLYCAIVVEGEQEQVYLVSDPDAPSYSAMPPSPTLLVANQRVTAGTPPSLVGGLLYRGDTDTTLAGSYIYMDGSQFWWTVASPADAPSYSATPPSPTLQLLVNQRVTAGTPPSLVGGLLYRSDTDTTLAGSYIYMDGSQFWWTVASPAARNSSTTRDLRVTSGGDLAGSHVTSFGEDDGNNALLLTTDGVYQVVGPSLCLTSIHTKTPMSTTRILEWVFGVIGALTTLAGGGYGAYKIKCKCCNRKKTEIHVNVTNGDMNIFNIKDGIELGRMGVDN